MRTTRARVGPWGACALALAAIAGGIAHADPGVTVAPAVGGVAPEGLVDEPEPDRPGHTPAIEHPEALAAFAASLARTAEGVDITRVVHLGDSSIGMDGLPHGLRQRFQRELGDAGPGFVLLQAHSSSYRNRTVEIHNQGEWDLCFVIRRCRADGRYGLGGVTVQSRGGAVTIIDPRDTVSRGELWYLAQPNGGRIRMQLGDRSDEIDTAAGALEDRWHVIERERGPHVLRVSSLGGGPARAYGVVLENGGPGVVWDSLSMIGAFTNRLLAQDEDHFARQLARRDPDLVVLNYGGNDLRRVYHGVTREELAAETQELLERVRSAVPSASCLVVGINDHTRSGFAELAPRHVETVLAAQRDAASRAGCAFWDTTDAMGGPGSFTVWQRHGMASSDGKHLSERGRQVIAARLHAALLHATRAPGAE